MQTVNVEPTLPESSHILWSNTLETSGNPKTDGLPDKTKDSEVTRQNHPFLWKFRIGNDARHYIEYVEKKSLHGRR